MRRRQVLALGAAALPGCIATPEPPERSPTPPNVFVEFTWTGTAYRVDFEYGTDVTEQNTRSLSLYDPEADERTFWVARNRDARATFPLEPGVSLTVEANRDAGLRVVWLAPDGERSATLARNRGEPA